MSYCTLRGFPWSAPCSKVVKLPEDSGFPAFVAQRIEHLTTDQKVGGSSPSKRTWHDLRQKHAVNDLGSKHFSESEYLRSQFIDLSPNSVPEASDSEP